MSKKDMKEEVKEQPQETLTSKEKALRTLNSTVELVIARRFILLFVILATAIAFALVRTRSFIDVPRNETRYSEESAKINYKQINQEALDSFQSQKQDQQVEVNSQFNPNRDNPFN